MDIKTEKILMYNPIAQSEKIFGDKHWSEFNEIENMFSLYQTINHNETKAAHLKSIGDTYFSMTWDEFKDLIIRKGFVPALEYDINYNKWDEPTIEEAILYYYFQKGLIIWATSFNNKTSVNGGNLYGEIQANNKEDEKTIWKWISTGGCIDTENNIWKTSHDVREGLFSKLDTLESAGKFLSKWTEKDKFLWFVDYIESDVPGYDYKEITMRKIKKCPKEFQNIIGID